MRDKMERLVILPFSVGCISEASVAVGAPPQPRKSRSDTNSPAPETKECKGEECENLYGDSKSNISAGLNRLLKGFKNLSQIFGEKEDEEEEEEEEEEREMEIGGPTDVQHVTHIGWDGHTITANPAITPTTITLIPFLNDHTASPSPINPTTCI